MTADPRPGPPEPRPVVFVGTGVIAQVAHEYFVRDGGRDVVAFAVEREYLRERELLGKPVIALDEVVRLYPPGSHEAFVAVGASQGHRLKRRLVAHLKGLGYRLASFVSPHAIVAPTASVGEHAIVMDFAIIQPFARVGVGVILWPGAIAGHHSVVGDFCMISGNSVVGAGSRLGDNGFMGINCTIIDKVDVAEDCLVGAGSVVTRATKPNQVLAGNPAMPKPYTFHEYFQRL